MLATAEITSPAIESANLQERLFSGYWCIDGACMLQSSPLHHPVSVLSSARCGDDSVRIKDGQLLLCFS